jgi:hypothetical protein
MRPHRQLPPRRRTAIAGLTLTAIVAACGGDDDEASNDATTEPAVAAESTTSAGSEEGDDVFCQAVLTAERAVATDDDAAIEPAFEAVTAAAPTVVKPAVDTVIAQARAGEDDTPAFRTAYGELIDYVKANCGFGALTVRATEYAFRGLPRTLEAGPTVIDFANGGQEWHELSVLRVNDGVAESVAELLALPEADAMSKVTTTGATFAGPGETGFAVIDLEPGRYVVICYLPTGATAENWARIQSGEHQGAPHFTAGMVHELTVT